MVLLPVELISFDHPCRRQNLYKQHCQRPRFCTEGEMMSNVFPAVFPLLDMFGNSLFQRMAANHGCPQQGKRRPEKWIQKMNVRGFQPDDIKVSVNEQTIVVHALHKEGEGDNIDSYETKRTVKIPENVNKEKLSSYMKMGTLIFEAPYIEKPSEVLQENETLMTEKHTEETAHHAMDDTEKELHSERENDEVTEEYEVDMEEETTQDDESNAETKQADEGDVPTQAEQGDENRKTETYRMNISLPSFHPENITVTSDNGTVSIKAKNEYKSDGVHISESFLRSFKLPENVDTEGLKCTRNDDGQLNITAPYRDQQQQLQITKEEHPMLK